MGSTAAGCTFRWVREGLYRQRFDLIMGHTKIATPHDVTAPDCSEYYYRDGYDADRLRRARARAPRARGPGCRQRGPVQWAGRGAGANVVGRPGRRGDRGAARAGAHQPPPPPEPADPVPAVLGVLGRAVQRSLRPAGGARRPGARG